MVNPFLRHGGIVVLLVCVVACEKFTPTFPSEILHPTPSFSAAPPRTPIAFPPLSGPSRTFVYDHELGYPVSDYTKQSRVVLFDDGAFELEYPTLAGSRYSGEYRATGGALTFLFEFQNRVVSEDSSDATGTLQANSLTIEFDASMQASDFDDAAYVLSQ